MPVIDKKSKMFSVIDSYNNTLLLIERFEMQLGVRDKTVEDICRSHGVNPDLFILFLNIYNNNDLTSLPNEDDLTSLLNYLKLSHSYYSDEIFPKIDTLIKTLSNKTSSDEMIMVKNFFEGYKKEVYQHFDYENSTVFPYISKLIAKEKFSNSSFTIADYKHNHHNIEDKLDDLKNLLIRHLHLNDDISTSRKILYLLYDLEKDLTAHAKIENDILIPLVENIEYKL